ncbi:MAG: hypothetical protein KA165_03070 [Saprospiraceae bacterium]|nr:hypothetical protein [Saprospiraceae bacterium]
MRRSLFALLCGLLFPVFLFAQTNLTVQEGVFALLQQYNPLDVVIETDIKQLKKDKNKDDEQWQPGVFKVFKGDSVVLQLGVQLAARGNMRKKTCFFPPVKIRFYTDKPENDSIADINELKLVSSCKNTALDEIWVQKEFLVYELYNTLTEQSFRVKRASIGFANPGKTTTSRDFCFLIESEKEMAFRLNAKPIKPKIVSHRSLDPAAYDRMALFEFMIGNTDWSIRARHNVKVLFLTSAGLNIPVPYDFDYSGLVGTDYAIPDPQTQLQSVQERYFMGQCRDQAEYRKLYELFLSKKEAFLQQCMGFTDLPKSARKQMTGYLEIFFNIIENPDLAKREIENNCGRFK